MSVHRQKRSMTTVARQGIVQPRQTSPGALTTTPAPPPTEGAQTMMPRTKLDLLKSKITKQSKMLEQIQVIAEKLLATPVPPSMTGLLPTNARAELEKIVALAKDSPVA